MPRSDSPTLRHLAVIGLYLAVAVLMTWPVAARLDSHIAGSPGDNYVYTWTLWLFRRSILAGSSPFFTTLIFYPLGVSIVLHSPILTKSIPGFFLQSFLSPVVTYNLALIGTIALTAYGTWLLLRYLVHDDRAAFLGGIIFAVSPVYMAHAIAGHMDYIGTEYIPFFLLFFFRAFDQHHWQDAILAGLFLSLVSLSNWAYLLFLFLFLLLHFALGLAAHRCTYLRWPVLRQYLLLGVVSCLAIAPFAIPLWKASTFGGYDETRYIGGAALDVSDLTGFVIPSVYHPVLGSLVQPITNRFTGNPAENTVFLGFSVLSLAVYGARHGGSRKARFWTLVALVFGLLSLGPGLHILGRFTFPWLSWMKMGTVAQRLGVPMKPGWVQMFDEAPMIPLPAAVFQLFPLFRSFRAASRLVIIVMLALAVLAAHGIASLLKQLQDRRWLCLPAPLVCTILLCGLVLFEFCVIPFPTTPAVVPEFYLRLRNEPGEFGIVELPFLPFLAQRQYHQTIHGKSLAYGYLSRVPESGFAYIDLLRQEVYHPTGFFESVDIRYLVLHKDQLASLEPVEAEALETALETNFELVESDDHLRVYRAYPLRSNSQ
ncbi:MAG: hypothetical protein SWK90_07035 [Chloroflexota bacterium]|nr:hypothetical protein [Chloroflexota bacterium]